MSTMRDREESLTSRFDAEKLWGRDFVQIDPSAFFYGFTSDPINLAVSIYTGSFGMKVQSAERIIVGTFSSKGERVYLGGIGKMDFRENCESFYLPKDEYRVHCLGWHLDSACDELSMPIEELLKYQHHAFVFEGSSKPGLSSELIEAMDKLRHKPNQSTDPTLSSGTSRAGHDPRLP